MAAPAQQAFAPAWERTSRLLFSPFRIGFWWRVAVAGIFANRLGGFGSTYRPLNVARADQTTFLGSGWPFAPALVAIGVVLVLVVIPAFMYVGCVMRFVLFDAVVSGTCRIRVAWRRYQTESWRYWLWQLLVVLVSLVAAVVVAGLSALIAFRLGWVANADQHAAGIILGIVLLIVVLLAGIALLVCVDVLSNDFVVPLMALERLGVTDAWRRLFRMASAERARFAGYLGLKFLLAVAAAIVFGLVTLLVAIVPSLVLAAAVMFVAGHWSSTLVLVGGLVVGIVAATCLVVVVGVANAPSQVFFRAFSIYFLADRYPPLQQFLEPPKVPGPAGPEAPAAGTV